MKYSLMKKHLLTLLVIIVLFNSAALAQSWTVYTTANSPLTENDYSYICVQGNDVWVGHSYNGVAKFDGSKWVTYNASGSSLVHDYIHDMAADANGNVWIGTYKGISKVKGSVWTKFDTLNTAMKGMIITGIDANPANNEVWVFTKNGSFDYQTITLFNGTTWTNLPALPASLKDRPVTHFAFTGTTTWLAMDGGNGGIGSYDGLNYTMYPAAVAKIWGADAMLTDIFGDVWIAGFDGLVRHSAGVWTYISSIDLGFTGMPVYSGMAINGTTLWIASNSGLVEYNMFTKKVVKIHTTVNSGLPSNAVHEIALLNGNLWLTTAAGVVKYNPTGGSGIGELGQRITLNAYPNPAQTTVTLHADNAQLDASVEVTDMMGKIVSVPVQQQDQHSLILDVNALATGIYSVRGTTTSGDNMIVHAVFHKY